MDLYCKHCGEPWELDSLHEIIVAAKIAPDFSAARKRFYKYGCGAFDAVAKICQHPPVTNTTKIAAYSALQDLLGDDVDGLCSMEDDLNFFLRD